MEEILFSSNIVSIGHFVLPRDHPSFYQAGYIGAPIFVFPKNGIWIQHEYQDAYVSDTSLVNFYNADQVYWRNDIHPDGDNCHWFSIQPSILCEILGLSDHEREIFKFQNMACNRETFIEHLRILDLLDADVSDEQLRVEEQVLGLFKSLIKPIFEEHKKPLLIKESHRTLIERVKQSLQESLDSNISLQQLASEHHVSPFHLSRLFKKVCGYGISTYRNQQRMRAAAIRISAGENDLATLALNLGYSSHSHLTSAFRQYYGCPPRHFQQAN